MISSNDYRRGISRARSYTSLNIPIQEQGKLAASRHLWAGTLFVVLGSIMLAAKGIFAKQLYALGVDFETVSATRSVLAVPGFALIAFLSGSFRSEVKLKPAHVASAIGAGLVCYYFGSVVNFYALTLIDASVERSLLFTFPAIVMVLSAMFGLAPISKSAMAALFMTFIGIALGSTHK